MANLNIKVENVLNKFYDIKPDSEIKGLYEVRHLGADPKDDVRWYFFSSNNSTYHSSGGDCVIRDINQSNSGYLERLKNAFEKAKRKNKKIFWLVLVFGDGIGLPPTGYDWMASVELLVDLDSITASLSMRNYPQGKGREKYLQPCCVRYEQDKYFNTTFMSCKDEEGNFTDKYMKDYFEYYDNRPYHDVIKVLGESSIEIDVDDKDYTLLELGSILSGMYLYADEGQKVPSIYIFGFKYGYHIIKEDFKAKDIIRAAQMHESYATELNKAIAIYKCMQGNLYGLSLRNIKNKPKINKSKRVTGATNVLLYGVPGAGKSFTIKKEYCSNEKYIERVVFHPDYTYCDFVGQILPRVIDENLKYIFTPGPFTNMLKKAENDPDNMYYLIIEEINRGNAPAIFGEVFQLLDRKSEDGGYDASELGESEYGISNYDVAKEVYEDPEHQIKIPSNMSIIATMNTADQNVFTLDTAFQRRWDMKQISNIMPEHQASIMIEGTKINWRAFTSVVNDLIIETNRDIAISEDKRLGAFFVKQKGLSIENFPEKVLKYLWHDAFKMDKNSIFAENHKTLEDIVRAYKTAKGDNLSAVLRPDVYGKMLSKMKENNLEIDNPNTSDE